MAYPARTTLAQDRRYWVTESHYTDPRDDTAAQWIMTGLKNNTTYNFRVRSYSGYSSPTYSSYSSVATATTSNYTLRYVSTSGSDTNGGTNSTTDAWRTISKACATLTAVQVAYVLAGNYTSDTCNTANAGSAGVGNRIILQANPGDNVTITTVPGSTNVLLIDQDHWTVDGINSTATTSDGADTVNWSGS